MRMRSTQTMTRPAEDLVAALSAISEVEEVRTFPKHDPTPDCWCRPKVASSADSKTVWILHKDLSKLADFDS
jgi:hypothetical protein